MIKVNGLNLYYGKFQALKNINVTIKENIITALIGPSGCGKSTLLKVFDRLHLQNHSVSITGSVKINNIDYKKIELPKLRKKIGMVFQIPNPFPLSVFDNVAYGPRVHGVRDRKKLMKSVHRSLGAVGLWDELKNNLKTNALKLSAEQKQRLCIARLLAVESEVLLMDEPCSALDPIATMNIENLFRSLKKDHTIIIVTHNMQQAARISDETGFMLLGELIEFGATKEIFTAPRDKRTNDYITGKYG